jgi:large repetitive protein
VTLSRRLPVAVGLLIVVLSSALELRAQLTPTITTTALNPAIAGVPYSFQMMATGGIGAYTWAATGLPTGLSITPSGPTGGVISGTTTTAGEFTNVRVTVRDILSNQADRTFTLTVYAQLGISTATLPGGMVNSAYPPQTLTPTGGVAPYSWSLPAGSSLPAGLTLSPAGVISGTPTTAGTTNFTVRVDDGSMQTATRPLSIAISPPTLAITTTSLPPGTVGTAYSQTLTATGGVPPFGWSLSAGSLPQGLTLSPAGVISGTPTSAGTSNFTVRVDDNTPQTAFRPLTIVISAPPLSITTTSLAPGMAGVSYSQNLSATGGTPPYSWSVTGSGSLPQGLTLSSGGALTGTPTSAGTFTFTARVADNGSQADTRSLSITISPPTLEIATTSLPSGTVGIDYSQNLSATGGTPPYGWSLQSGSSLPSGLMLSPSGTISGRPTAAGNSNFTVTVTDSGSQSRSQTLSITISPPVLSVTTTSLPSGTVGAAYSAPALTASGGTPPYSWSLQSGNLPMGLGLSAGGAISGLPTTVGTVNFTVRVADSATQIASRSLSIAINPALLTILSASPLPSGNVGTPYSLTLTATGGIPPFGWSVATGTLPAGLSLSPAGVISGIPTTVGTSNVTIRVDDGLQTAVRVFSISINSVTYTLSLTNIQDMVNPAQQIPIGMSISQPQQIDLQGTLTLAFTSNGAVPNEDPSVVGFSNGTRSADFTIPANTTAAVFQPGLLLLTGTVSGSIVFRADIRNGPTALSVGAITVRQTVPQMTSVGATRTSNTLRIQVTGYSPERKISGVEFGFDVATATGTQRVNLTRSVENEFDAWYRSAASSPYGSSFLFEQTFAVQGDATSIQAVTVKFTNGAGSGSSTAVPITAN